MDLFGQSAVSPASLSLLGPSDAPAGILVGSLRLDPIVYALLAARRYYKMTSADRVGARSWALDKWTPLVQEELLDGISRRKTKRAQDTQIDKPDAPDAPQGDDWRGDPSALTTTEAATYAESKKRISAYLQAAKEDYAAGNTTAAQMESRMNMAVSTEVQAAFNEAGVIAAVKKGGKGAKIMRLPEGGACRPCRQLFLGIDGEPKVFSVSQILSYGTNAGRHMSEWMPTLWPVHPNCRCSVELIEDGS